ncbi:MAG: hypothetical protein P8K08_15570 [Fuerstiella sp.]|jgi:hypothetical protein|nr:hypothetical protein [Fuerstiella sp.]
MIDHFFRILPAVVVLAISSGCQLPWHKEEARYVDPALPMSLSTGELVDYLNRQNQGLESWRCTTTRMEVRLPNALPVRLKGNIACQAPRRFRLTADNVIARADLGSNDNRCWFYSRPGEPAVMTWKHEDSAMIQQVPSGVPYIDPNWLMLVLGVTPLDATDYEVSKGLARERELWLSAIEDSPSGRPLRRVVKVDTIRGVIREHSVYDSEANPLVRAHLSRHQSWNGHLIPKLVKLQFPQMDSEITLTFEDIETNPHLPEGLWRLPDDNVQVVDVANVIRQKFSAQYGRQKMASPPAYSPRVRLEPPVFRKNDKTALSPTESTFDGASGATTDIAAPDWDTPISFSKPATAGDTFGPQNAASRPPNPKSKWNWKWWQ